MIKTKNDLAWELLFKRHNIVKKVLDNGRFEILSAEINPLREARLMTKFDHRSQLPKIFSENGFAILPVSRKSYVIGDFEAFSTCGKLRQNLSEKGFYSFDLDQLGDLSGR